MASKIEFALITSPRIPSYLGDTIASLGETGFFLEPEKLTLRIIASGKFKSDDQQLSPYQNNSDFIVERNLPTPPDGEPQHDLGSNHRHGIIGLEKSDSTHLCIFEDDLKFAKGWLNHLRSIISEIEKVHGDRWVLTLFLGGTDDPIKFMKSGKKWYLSKKRPHVGTPGIVYPRRIALEFSSVIFNRCISNFELPIDLLLGKWADENKIPILASAPCLIQHIGKISTTSPNHGDIVTHGFIEDVR